MRDLAAVRHPESKDLQRCADGDLDLARDARLVAHIESCVSCRAEIEQTRRVTAALSLTSAPPPELFERIKARREAGERVVLPVPDVERPVDANPIGVAAATTSRPAVPPHRSQVRRAWRWTIGPIGVAAVALLAVRLAHITDIERPVGDPAAVASADTLAARRPDARPTLDSGPTPPTPTAPQLADATTRAPDRLRGVGAPPESSAAEDRARDSARAHRADSARRNAGSEPGPHFIVRDTGDGLVIGLAAVSPSLDSGQAWAMDPAVRALKQDPARRVLILYVDPANNYQSESWDLAVLVQDYLESVGVARERVQLRRVLTVNKAGLPRRREAVEVVLTRPQNE